MYMKHGHDTGYLTLLSNDHAYGNIRANGTIVFTVVCRLTLYQHCMARADKKHCMQYAS